MKVKNEQRSKLQKKEKITSLALNFNAELCILHVLIITFYQAAFSISPFFISKKAFIYQLYVRYVHTCTILTVLVSCIQSWKRMGKIGQRIPKDFPSFVPQVKHSCCGYMCDVCVCVCATKFGFSASLSFISKPRGKKGVYLAMTFS